MKHSAYIFTNEFTENRTRWFPSSAARLITQSESFTWRMALLFSGLTFLVLATAVSKAWTLALWNEDALVPWKKVRRFPTGMFEWGQNNNSYHLMSCSHVPEPSRALYFVTLIIPPNPMQ